MPSRSVAEAVPLEVSCAVPSTASPSQYLAVASQKVTSPGETGVLPAVTVAVSVTGEPLVTAFTERTRFVAVAGATGGLRCGSMALSIPKRKSSVTIIPGRERKGMRGQRAVDIAVMY